MDISAYKNKLSDFVNQELELWDFSGVIRVIKDGSVFWEACRGYSSAEFGIKNSHDTRFSLASVTKQFTAFAIMLLADKQLIDLDKNANIYLPESLKIPDGISVRHLLSHSSGLYNFYNFEDDFYIGADRLPYERDSYFRDWIMHQPMQKTGTSFNYNNSNYNLLAWIIEYVSGKSYTDFLRSSIFSPLNMENTVFDDGLLIIHNKANNYMYDYGKLIRVPYVNSLFHLGAAGLVSSCDDLQKLFNCFRDKKLLSEEGYRQFFTENLDNYCFGLNKRTRGKTTEYFHGGDANGISTLTQYFFEDDLCILILSNNESLNQYRLGSSIAEILYGGTPKPSLKPAEIFIPEAELQKYAGEYLHGKIRITVKDGRLFLVRPNQNIHIELYCISPGHFMRRHEEQSSAYQLWPEGAEKPSIWGYSKISEKQSRMTKNK